MPDTHPSSDAAAVDVPLMCAYHCFPADTVELGKIADSLSVIRNSTGVHLLGGQGHSNDVLLTFTAAPTPDPTAGMTEDELDAETPAADAAFTAWDQWKTDLDQAMGTLLYGYDLREAYHLMRSLIAAGYDPHVDEYAEMWIYDAAGRIIADYDQQHAPERVRLAARPAATSDTGLAQ